MILFPEVEEKETPKRRLAPTFKPYNNRQIQVIYDIESLIPEHHEARIVDEMVESVSDEPLFSHYKGGGRASYHPKMILKIILYGYTQEVYSCRGIEKLTKENIPTMWLAAMQQLEMKKSHDLSFLFLMAAIYKNKHASIKRTSKMRRTGPISKRMTVLFVRTEGK